MPSCARGLGKGWPGGRGQEMEPRKMQRGGNGKPRAPHRELGPQPLPRETEALRTAGKQTGPDSRGRWTFPWRSSRHTAGPMDRAVLPFPSLYNILQNWFSMKRMEGFEQWSCKDKEEIREGCCGLVTELCLTNHHCPSARSFLCTAGRSPLFQSSTYA